MEFRHVRLEAPEASLFALADFYQSALALERLDEADAGLALMIGETRLDFLPSTAEPFYHFALLGPGNRYRELLDWIADRAELLSDPETGEVVFDFDSWGAQACYFHDPAGNIVELIVHHGIGETTATGSFSGEELLGVSELGLVGDTRAMARLLEQQLGLELWDGTVEIEGRLAFVGERARTLILSPPDRPWLPTGRPAEAHPLDVELSGPAKGEALLNGSRYRIRRSAQATTR